MGIFDGCLLACDIDGTLMDNGYINPENKEKIKFFENQGGKFVISTGRGVAALSNLLEQIPSISVAVVANGCVVCDYKTNEILFQHKIDENEYHYVDFIAGLGFDVGIEVHSGNNAFTLRHNRNSHIHQEYENFEAPKVEIEDISHLKWNKVLYLFENYDEREKAKEIISKERTDCAFLSSCAQIGGEVQYYLEQVPNGVSKAKGLLKLCEILNISKENLFAIGDYYNDVEMLRLSSVCAVPFTSPEDIKQIADYITCTCREGAVADFINYLTSKFNANGQSTAF